MASTLIVLSLLVAGSLALPSLRIDPNLSWRVVGGSNAPNGLYPYQVSFQMDKYHICGGTIVNEEWIITAAHCVDGMSPSSITAVVGLSKLSARGKVYKIKEIHVHPEFDIKTVSNDIAIVKVNAIKFNKKVGKIAVETEFVGGDVPVTLSGWGSTRLGGSLPDYLQHIDLKTTTVEYCNERHTSNRVYDTQICTLTKTGEGACHGDSGGPLVVHKGDERVLAGIVSWGEPCARGFPDVYCRPSAYIDWLNKTCDNCLNQ